MSAALARYVRAYKGMWQSGSIDPAQPLGPQLEPRVRHLRESFVDVSEQADLDAGASDPASNFGTLLTALEREVVAVEHLVRGLMPCAQLTVAERVDCELAAWGDKKAIEQASRNVTAALALLQIPELADDPSESVDFSVTVGECFNEGTPYEVVDCSTSHDGEVFSEYEFPDRLGAPYPGESDIVKVASRECKRTFESYVGVRQRFSELNIAFVFPSPASWSAGQRVISCVVTLESGKLSESIRGSGR